MSTISIQTDEYVRNIRNDVTLDMLGIYLHTHDNPDYKFIRRVIDKCTSWLPFEDVPEVKIHSFAGCGIDPAYHPEESDNGYEE